MQQPKLQRQKTNQSAESMMTLQQIVYQAAAVKDTVMEVLQEYALKGVLGNLERKLKQCNVDLRTLEDKKDAVQSGGLSSGEEIRHRRKMLTLDIQTWFEALKDKQAPIGNVRARMKTLQQLQSQLFERMEANELIVPLVQGIQSETTRLRSQVQALSGIGNIKRPSEIVPTANLIAMDPLHAASMECEMLRSYEAACMSSLIRVGHAVKDLNAVRSSVNELMGIHDQITASSSVRAQDARTDKRTITNRAAAIIAATDLFRGIASPCRQNAQGGGLAAQGGGLASPCRQNAQGGASKEDASQ